MNDPILGGFAAFDPPVNVPLFQNDDPVADGENLRQVGVDDDARNALFRQTVEKRMDFGFGADIDARDGSSTITMRGRRATHLAMTTFCWLPPDRFSTF
jgi:hypothetical protein